MYFTNGDPTLASSGGEDSTKGSEDEGWVSEDTYATSHLSFQTGWNGTAHLTQAARQQEEGGSEEEVDGVEVSCDPPELLQVADLFEEIVRGPALKEPDNVRGGAR